MAKFFFDFHDGQEFVRDSTGLEFASAEIAHKEGLTLISELASEAVAKGEYKELWVRVRNEDGTPVVRAALTVASDLLDGSPETIGLDPVEASRHRGGAA